MWVDIWIGKRIWSGVVSWCGVYLWPSTLKAFFVINLSINTSSPSGSLSLLWRVLFFIFLSSTTLEVKTRIELLTSWSKVYGLTVHLLLYFSCWKRHWTILIQLVATYEVNCASFALFYWFHSPILKLCSNFWFPDVGMLVVSGWYSSKPSYACRARFQKRHRTILETLAFFGGIGTRIYWDFSIFIVMITARVIFVIFGI